MTSIAGEGVVVTQARANAAQWVRRLQLAAGGRSGLAGTAAGLLALAVARLVARVGATASGVDTVGVGISVLVAGVVAALEWRRAAVARLTPQRAALWLEEHAPTLRYALVSVTDAGVSPQAARSLEGALARADWDAPAWRAIRQSLAWPLGAALVGVAAVAFVPSRGAVHAGDRATTGGEGSRTVPPVPLGTVLVTVRPPAYTALAAQRLESPSIVRAYPGSTVDLEGGGAASATRAVVNDRALAVTGDDARWKAQLRTDTARALVRVQRSGAGAGTDARLVAIEPLVDSAPVVTLRTPARDTVLRAPEGTIALIADVHDDLALTRASFEYIISSGEGERFTFKSGTIGALPAGSGRRATLRSALSLPALGLTPGDVIHLRAVARDRNDVTGPGVGTSESRTIRIARAGEYDSVAVEQAPPPDADKSVISQRMLINLTEALLKRAPRLGRGDVVAESRRIGRDQARLRKQVSDIIFTRLGDAPDGEHFHGDGHAHAEGEALGNTPLTPEQLLKAAERATQGAGAATDFDHDETPVVAINRPMLEAYNAMWDAGRALDGGEPRRALPPMYVALAAIQRARAAERLYLRGAPPRVVVDLARVRLAGKDKGDPGRRTPRTVTEASRGPLLQRLSQAIDLLPRDAAAGVDSLIVLRLAVVGELPLAASALEDAIGNLRAARDATTSLLRARRALDEAMVARDALPAWGGVR